MTGARTIGRVLLIDDEPGIRATAAAILTREGWEVALAENGREGLATVERAACEFDCVVSDVHMPELDGHRFVAALGERVPDLPVLLMTANPDLDGAVRAMELGALNYISKPFTPERLASEVARAARRHGVARMMKRAAAAAEAPDLAAQSARLSRALATSWMAYQPLVDATSGAVRAYEALLRTDEPELRRPDVFIAAAERLGRVPELGRTVRRLVAADLAAAPRDVRVFVNLHPLELADEALFGDANPLHPSAARIVIELTERAALDALADAPRRVAELRRLGYAIALDDLGAGYASIGSLAAVAPEVVKLDMGLIRNLHLEPRQHRIVTAIATLCRELGSEVVAEGIETVEEQGALADHVDLFQGYLFGRPARGFP